MATTHFVNRCKHGKIMGQCRCASPNKAVRIVPCNHPDSVDPPLGAVHRFNRQVVMVDSVGTEIIVRVEPGVTIPGAVVGVQLTEDGTPRWVFQVRQDYIDGNMA